MTFCIYLDHKPAFTGEFSTWWDAYASAINRAALCGARNIKVKAA